MESLTVGQSRWLLVAVADCWLESLADGQTLRRTGNPAVTEEWDYHTGRYSRVLSHRAGQVYTVPLPALSAMPHGTGAALTGWAPLPMTAGCPGAADSRACRTCSRTCTLHPCTPSPPPPAVLLRQTIALQRPGLGKNTPDDFTAVAAHKRTFLSVFCAVRLRENAAISPSFYRKVAHYIGCHVIAEKEAISGGIFGQA